MVGGIALESGSDALHDSVIYIFFDGSRTRFLRVRARSGLDDCRSGLNARALFSIPFDGGGTTL